MFQYTKQQRKSLNPNKIVSDRAKPMYTHPPFHKIDTIIAASDTNVGVAQVRLVALRIFTIWIVQVNTFYNKSYQKTQNS